MLKLRSTVPGLRTYAAALLLGTLLLFGAGCGQPPPGAVGKAVRSSLETQVPPTLAGWITGGQHASISELRIVRVGRPQGAGNSRYWPVRAYAKGTCQTVLGGPRAFEGELEFRVRQNEYGDWVATPTSL